MTISPKQAQLLDALRASTSKQVQLVGGGYCEVDGSRVPVPTNTVYALHRKGRLARTHTDHRYHRDSYRLVESPDATHTKE